MSNETTKTDSHATKVRKIEREPEIEIEIEN